MLYGQGAAPPAGAGATVDVCPTPTDPNCVPSCGTPAGITEPEVAEPGSPQTAAAVWEDKELMFHGKLLLLMGLVGLVDQLV